MSPHRTLQELLKQPGGEVSPVDGPLSSTKSVGANSISARMLRSRSGEITYSVVVGKKML